MILITQLTQVWFSYKRLQIFFFKDITPNALKLCTYFVTKQVIKQAYADLFIRYLNSP